MRSEIRDVDGFLLEVQKNGETLSEPVDRARISDASIQELEEAVNDIKDKPTRQAVGKIVEVLTGETVEEAKK